jgi:hypothetical protein
MLTPENQLFLIRYKIVLEILSCSVSIKGRAISVQTVQYNLSQSEVFEGSCSHGQYRLAISHSGAQVAIYAFALLHHHGPGVVIDNWQRIHSWEDAADAVFRGQRGSRLSLQHQPISHLRPAG